MSANEKGIIAVTGRAHCQRQVAFFQCLPSLHGVYVCISFQPKVALASKYERKIDRRSFRDKLAIFGKT